MILEIPFHSSSQIIWQWLYLLNVEPAPRNCQLPGASQDSTSLSKEGSHRLDFLVTCVWAPCPRCSGCSVPMRAGLGRWWGCSSPLRIHLLPYPCWQQGVYRKLFGIYTSQGLMIQVMIRHFMAFNLLWFLYSGIQLSTLSIYLSLYLYKNTQVFWYQISFQTLLPIFFDILPFILLILINFTCKTDPLFKNLQVSLKFI